VTRCVRSSSRPLKLSRSKTDTLPKAREILQEESNVQPVVSVTRQLLTTITNRRHPEMPSDCLRRYPRSISRLDGALQDRRPQPGHELPVYGYVNCALSPDIMSNDTCRRLRRPWILLRRDCYPPRRPQNSLPSPHHHPPRQPRIPPNHSSLRLLRRMPPQIR
jgi:hypothetical protein